MFQFKLSYFKEIVVCFVLCCFILNIIFAGITLNNFCCSKDKNNRSQSKSGHVNAALFRGGASPHQFQLKRKQSIASIKPAFKRLTIISCISFLLGSMCESLDVILEYTDHKDIAALVSYGNTGFWYVGKLALYGLFLSRLKFSFEETIYSYSKWWYILIIFLLIVETGLWMTYFAFYSKFSNEWFFKTALIGFIIDTIASLLILTLFIRQLVHMTRTNIQLGHGTDGNSSKIFNLITRYTIVTGTVIISSMCLGIAYVTMYYIWWKQGISDFTNWLLHLFGVPDPVINLFCLILYYQFPLSIKLYKSMCCICDKCCKNVCDRLTIPKNDSYDLSY